jgi:hypothetical protein
MPSSCCRTTCELFAVNSPAAEYTALYAASYLSVTYLSAGLMETLARTRPLLRSGGSGAISDMAKLA